MKTEEQKQYEVEPDAFFWNRHIAGYDGYDIMKVAEARGWHAIAGWAKEGYDMGSWPYVVVYSCKRAGKFLIAVYVEGDMTQYALPDKETRNALLDNIAFFYWKNRNAEWVKGYASVEELPADLRGPYRR